MAAADSRGIGALGIPLFCGGVVVGGRVTVGACVD